MGVCSVMSHSAIPWTIAHQAPPSMGFSRQDCWSVLQFPFPPPGELPDPGIEPMSLESPVSAALAGILFATVQSGKPLIVGMYIKKIK